MSRRILVDVNLSPEWVGELERHGYEAVHWSTMGDCTSADAAIMERARANGHAVFTHDLDFSALLALTQADGPSVLQMRGQDVLPEDVGPQVIAALRQYESAPAAGAIVVVDRRRSRVRVLQL